MAGETANIGAIAEKVSQEVLLQFGWSEHAHRNFNFPCYLEEKHQKKSSPSHPCDVIFSHPTPYSDKRIYFLTDLKSYSADTLKDKRSLKKAIQELCKSVECAKIAREFQEKIDVTQPWELHGLLFIWNHDGNFDRNFPQHLLECAQAEVELPRSSRLYIIGPNDIQFYYDVLNDLERTLGQGNLVGSTSFFYPNQIDTRPLDKNNFTAATIDFLKGALLPVVIRLPNGTTKAHIYYRGAGADYREFEFLLDYCFRYSLVTDERPVVFKLPYPNGEFQTHLATAKDTFSQHFYHKDRATEKIATFTAERVRQCTVTYSEYEVGMETRRGVQYGS